MALASPCSLVDTRWQLRFYLFYVTMPTWNGEGFPESSNKPFHFFSLVRTGICAHATPATTEGTIIVMKAGDPAQQFCAQTAFVLGEHLSLVPRTHIRWLRPNDNFSSGRSNIIFWPSQAIALTYTNLHTYIIKTTALTYTDLHTYIIKVTTLMYTNLHTYIVKIF